MSISHQSPHKQAILKHADFSDRQIRALIRLIETHDHQAIDRDDLETSLTKLEFRIMHRMYVAFAAQSGLLAAVIFGLFELLA